MKRKLAAILTAGAICAALAACGGTTSSTSSKTTSSTSSKTTSSTTSETASSTVSETTSNTSSETTSSSDSETTSATPSETASTISSVEQTGEKAYCIFSFSSASGDEKAVLTLSENEIGLSSLVNVFVDDNDLACALSDYSSHYTIVTSVENEGTLGEYTLLARDTGESLGMLNVEELNQKYNPLAGDFELVDWSNTPGEKVKLSSFDPEKIYRLQTDGEDIVFDNDTGKNYLLFYGNQKTIPYALGFTENTLEQFGKGSDTVSTSIEEELMIRVVEADMATIDHDKMDNYLTYVQGQKSGAYLAPGFYTVLLANNSDEDVILLLYAEAGTTPVEYTLPAGGVLGFDKENALFIQIK